MGILVPPNFPMSSLANEAERRVVELLCDRLTDTWMVIPDVGLLSQRDHQIDIVIAHPRDGVAVVEVKGHRRLRIRAETLKQAVGLWNLSRWPRRAATRTN